MILFCFDLAQQEDDMLFGGYAPSLGGGRPTTAPDKRSVRFADDIGFDVNDNDEMDKMLSQRRPKTAPAKNNMTSDYLDSSLEESMSRELFNSKNGKGMNKKNSIENFEDDDDKRQSTKAASKTNVDHNKKEESSINSKSSKGIISYQLFLTL